MAVDGTPVSTKDQILHEILNAAGDEVAFTIDARPVTDPPPPHEDAVARLSGGRQQPTAAHGGATAGWPGQQQQQQQQQQKKRQQQQQQLQRQQLQLQLQQQQLLLQHRGLNASWLPLFRDFVTPPAAPTTQPKAAVADGTWANSSVGVHTFLTFDSSWLATELKDDPTDPRAKRLDFLWGASQAGFDAVRAANPNTRISKYIPCCRDTQVKEFGAAAIANYTRRGWANRVLYQCDRKTPAYYSRGSPGRASHRSIPLDFSNPDVVDWQAEEFARPAAALGYDALALDNTELPNFWGGCGVWRTPTQWVQLYNGSIIDPAFELAVTTWLGALKAKVNAITTKRGKPMAIIPNFVSQTCTVISQCRPHCERGPHTGRTPATSAALAPHNQS